MNHKRLWALCSKCTQTKKSITLSCSKISSLALTSACACLSLSISHSKVLHCWHQPLLQASMLDQGNTAAGAASLLTPMPRTLGRGALAPINANVVVTVPSVDQVSIIESTTITQTREPLNDLNWSVWKGSMKCMFSLCNVTEYVFGAI